MVAGCTRTHRGSAQSCWNLHLGLVGDGWGEGSGQSSSWRWAPRPPSRDWGGSLGHRRREGREWGRASVCGGLLGTACRARSKTMKLKYFTGAPLPVPPALLRASSAALSLAVVGVGQNREMGSGSSFLQAVRVAALAFLAGCVGSCSGGCSVQVLAAASSSRCRVGRSPPVPVAVCAQSSCPTLPGRAPGDPASCDPLPFVVFALTPRSPLPLSKPPSGRPD